MSIAGDCEKSRPCAHAAGKNPLTENGTGAWRKELVLAITFAILFHLVDSATAFAQKSAAAPAFYLSVGPAIALVLWGGPKYWPLVLV